MHPVKIGGSFVQGEDQNFLFFFSPGNLLNKRRKKAKMGGENLSPNVGEVAPDFDSRFVAIKVSK